MAGGTPTSLVIVPCIVIALALMIIVPGMLRAARGNRRRILARGNTTFGSVTAIERRGNDPRCVVRFAYQTAESGRDVAARQASTVAAVDALHLAVGSEVDVRYLPRAPRAAFLEALVIAERLAEARIAGATVEDPPPVYFVSYSDPTEASAVGRNRLNSFRWAGAGDLTFTADSVRVAASVPRLFRSAEAVRREFVFIDIVNVEVHGEAVAMQFEHDHSAPSHLRFWAVDETQAKAIAARLPATTTATHVATMAETAAYAERVALLSPNVPVTYSLIAINVVLFAIAAALGAGVLAQASDVLVRLGSDYTPLTLGGQWWRLFTSTFLHVGILHLTLNMWVLFASGPLAERIYGRARYLSIYIVAGLTGSVASLWWHPVVNGVGASGAIFGVYGALLAFFLRNEGGVPAAVIKRQLIGVGLFLLYNLLVGAGIPDIDNAAHLGGLAGGFVLGFLLSRPLDATRLERDWSVQWVRAGGLVAAGVALTAFLLATGRFHPRSPTEQAAEETASAAQPTPRRGATSQRTHIGSMTSPIRSFGGAYLGETEAELYRRMGRPITITDDGYRTYAARGGVHDGVIDIRLDWPADRDTRRVSSIEFAGMKSAAPPGLPYVPALSREEIQTLFGDPIATSMEMNASDLEFEDGAFIRVLHGNVIKYGIRSPEP